MSSTSDASASRPSSGHPDTRPDFAWIELPIFDEYGYSRHRRGISEASGLACLGLPWLYNQGSSLLAGVGSDAAHLAERITPAPA